MNEIHNKPSSSSTVKSLSTVPLSLPRKSNRQLLPYSSSGEKAVCIVCNEKKYNKGREVEMETMFIKELKETVHKAETKLIEYAKNSYI